MTYIRFITACIAGLLCCVLLCGAAAAETGDDPGLPVEETEALTASFTAEPPTTFVGQTITFTSTTAGEDLTYTWDFGDGTTISGSGEEYAEVTHAYDADEDGIFTVTLTVTDIDGNESSASLDVTSQTPTQAIKSMITTFGEMEGPFGLQNSFSVKLNAATRSLDRGHDKTATNQLNAFVHHAEAQSGKKLTQEEATGFISYIREIISEVNKDRNGASEETEEADLEGTGKSNKQAGTSNKDDKEKGNSGKDSKDKGNSGNSGNGGGNGGGNGKSK
ncbi:MAG: PKD domain-containing protein [Methanomicrobiales archaeon]|nr:PKD domain-containing protein [Methanomicrobiales archaeon]